MKKVILPLLVLLFAGFTANAQLSESDVMIGANVANLDFQFDEKTDLSISPKAMWFIKDGLALGGYVNFGVEHPHGADGNIFKYGIGPLARYYVLSSDLNLLKQTRFFLEANVGFEGSNNTISDSDTNGLGFGVGPGITYFITNNIGLEAMLKYNGLVGFGSETYKNGLNLSIGFQIYLPSQRLANVIR